MNKYKTMGEIHGDMNRFSGTEQWHQWSILFPGMTITDGVKHIADRAGCYWLIDAMASHIAYGENKKVKELPMLFWTLEVNEDKTGVLYAVEDSGLPRLIEQKFEYIDLPAGTLEIWYADNVFLLKSEY